MSNPIPALYAIAASMLLPSFQSLPSNLYPLIVVPGSGGNQLDARLTPDYKPTGLLCNRGYPLVKDGDGWFRLWFDPGLVLLRSLTRCFADRMTLRYDETSDDYYNAAGVETRVNGFGSTESMLYLDPSLRRITVYMSDLVESLERLGYVDGQTLCELLNMVKKHSSSLGKTNVDEQDASDVEMDSRFWRDVFDLYFVSGKESRAKQDDDLIFFVRKLSLYKDQLSDNREGASPYFVRRWASELDKLLGDASDSVDWSHQVLCNYPARQDSSLSPIYKVVKVVYASPSRVNFHLDAKKEVETTAAYPDICFAVEDFDSTFAAVVLSSTDHCYCVLLNAHDGAAFPSTREHKDCSSSINPPLQVDTGSGHSMSSKITLFSGFVSYQMVRESYIARKSHFSSLWPPGSPGKIDRLYMKGPGGRGEVEVAVAGVVDQSNDDEGPFSPVMVSKKGFGVGSIFHKAMAVANVAARHAYAAASASSSHNDEMIPLKCCLMSISLPWEHIAYDLLFKGNPPVNL